MFYELAGMESDILVEAFRIAPTMHSLKYVRFIADGDSSTHAELTAKVPYGRYIEKLSVPTMHVSA